MSIGVYGRQPLAKEGQYFQATVRQWRPIHDLVLELCSDLLDAETLEGLGYCDGAGPSEVAVCRAMVNRFELWMERHVDGHRMASDLRVTPDGRFVSSQQMAQQPDLPTVSPYQVDDAVLKRWIEFLRNCGGFVVGGASIPLVDEGDDPTLRRWYVWLDRRPVGPISAEHLKRLASRGLVTRDTLVGRCGETDLACAWRVQSLFPPPTVARGVRAIAEEPVATNVPPIAERRLVDALLAQVAAEESTTQAADGRTGLIRRRAMVGVSIAAVVMFVGLGAPWPGAKEGRLEPRSLEAAPPTVDRTSEKHGADLPSIVGGYQLEELACVLGTNTIERHVRTTESTGHRRLVSDYVAVYVRQNERWTLRDTEVRMREAQRPENVQRYHVDASGAIYCLDGVDAEAAFGPVQVAVLEELRQMDPGPEPEQPATSEPSTEDVATTPT